MCYYVYVNSEGKIVENQTKSESELAFEREVVEYLTQIGGVKQWQYSEEIKTTDHLWANFKRILEQNNRAKLDAPLSDTEFGQIKRIISAIDTPYQAGQFLYGTNGVSEVEVDLDDGKHVYLTVFDQAQVGGGNTVYQVVNQIERPKVIDGKPSRRFDVTLLINGLPIIQIELKKVPHSTGEALNQMEQYIAERQYGGIFSTLQILVAMTPYDIRYMANTTRDKFNRAFAFNWQDEENSRPIHAWKDFADKVLSIPMAHNMATQYMILDGTKNRESIKVMRPYQVYATKRVLDKVRKYDFRSGDGRLGYIWHTTGSGKTITSFKTAWLASRLPNVGKVIFLVDRIALTNQTADAYKAYDPASRGDGGEGIVTETASTADLRRKLTKKSDKNIIVTSIQKMSLYVQRENFAGLDENILFIVDEAHRSTGGGSENNEGMLKQIRRAVPNSAWVGYTGTPKFPETEQIFGDKLHVYTIKEAIADKNVLGFHAEFKETIKAPDNPTEDDIDDNVRESVYDRLPQHIEKVVEDIFANWKERSNDRKYNAILTVHVGGNKPSTPRAMQYFDKFAEFNARRPEGDRLKVAVSFSADSSNSDNQLRTNENLHRAIKAYNELFGTAYDMTTTKAYTDDVIRRLNKTADDRDYLDLAIVVDQLLTGFDAPELNTLYVDRTLKGANLIQAYSRTNRMHSLQDKPWGNIVNYRWPKQNEYEMNEAFAVYSNRASADRQISLVDLKEGNEDSGIIAKPFGEALAETKDLVGELRALTDGFAGMPPSEKAQDELFGKLKEYNRSMSRLKQYTTDDEGDAVSAYDDPEEFYKRLGITEHEEIILTTTIADDLKRSRAKKADVDISDIDLDMIHVHSVTIDYDYLIELIAKMADEVHADDMDGAEKTRKDIHAEIAKSDTDAEKRKVRKFVERIFSKEFTFDTYPAPRGVEEMNRVMERFYKESDMKQVADFIYRWGLGNSIRPKELERLIGSHRLGRKDMDKQGRLTEIVNGAHADYAEIAADDVRKLPWVVYRNQFQREFYTLADAIKKGE